MSKTSQWLTDEYLEWQRQSGKRRSVVEFAAYLDVSQQSLSSWMNGKNEPRDKKNIVKLYEKLGPEIYDVLGLERPCYASEELDEEIRELALAIREVPEEYRSETRSALMDVLRQVIKETKDRELLPKEERLSEISDEDLKTAVDSIKKAVEQKGDTENGDKTEKAY